MDNFNNRSVASSMFFFQLNRGLLVLAGEIKLNHINTYYAKTHTNKSDTFFQWKTYEIQCGTMSNIFLVINWYPRILVVVLRVSSSFCEKGWTRYSPSESCVKFFHAKISYNSAESECKIKHGGKLVTAETQTKNFFLKGILASESKFKLQYANHIYVCDTNVYDANVHFHESREHEYTLRKRCSFPY